MAVHFHALKVKAVTKETADCVIISFDIPEELSGTFNFREGQNITIRKNINGQEIRRSYSICNAPYESGIKVAVKKVEGGLFSAYANNELEPGDQLEVMPPTGKFNSKLSGTRHSNYLGIAAGSGITPIISIIKHTLHEDPLSEFTLIFANRSRSSIIFFEQLEGLKNRYINRLNVIHILSRERTEAEINYGRINAEKLNSLKPLLNYKRFDEVYICGPEELISRSEKFLIAEGLDPSQVHYELFTTIGQTKTKIEKVVPGKVDDTSSLISLTVDGRTFEFQLGFKGESILDTALKLGADLPYACKGGVCCSCRAKLTEGEVHMDVNYALEAEEVSAGFILTCQSHPLSPVVKIDFDVK